MMLAGLPVTAAAVEELAALVRNAGGDDLADRLARAIDDGVRLLSLSIAERAILLIALEDAPEALSDLRAVLVNDLAWRVEEELD